MKALNANDSTAAEKLFSESVFYYKDPPSYYQLGKIQMAHNTIKSRNSGLFNLKQAASLEKNNLEFRLEYASVQTDTKLNQYEEIINDFPESVRALVAAGGLCCLYYRQYDNMILKISEASQWNNKREKKTFFEKGEKYLLKALSLSPFDKDVLLLLAELYLEAKDFDKSVYYLCLLKNVNPDIPKAHLIYGIILNNRNEKEKAKEEFDKAFALMGKEEADDYKYKSVLEILKPRYDINEKYDLKIEVQQLMDRFWKISDPSENPKINERIIEHYARVAYANLNFSIPSKKVKGWNTPRGEMYIRYGAPDSLVKKNHVENISKLEIWCYKNLIAYFIYQKNDGSYKLWGKTDEVPDPLINSFVQYENKKIDMLIDYRQKGKVVYLENELYVFKNLSPKSSDKFDAYYVHWVPFDIADGKKYETPVYDYSMNLYDWEIDPVLEKSGRAADNTLIKIAAEDKNPNKTNCIEFKLPVDIGVAKIKINKLADSSLFTSFKYFDVAEFPDTSVSLSAPIPAYSVDKDYQIPGGINRYGISFTPKLKGIHKKGEPAFVYFEIYGLKKNKEGLAEFKQEISVKEYKEFEEEGTLIEGLTDFFHSIFGNPNEISLTNYYRSKDQDVQHYKELDLNKLKPGKYELAVIITDNVSGKIGENFTIIEVK